ncbi:MAG: NAD(P)/FAD-dependent oxidoreductase [Candidatus Micrarchaeota archaeon]|nr:NAD(P)/FAD-dependent oxidoreductase [Candidatus Micrarchaeota archaeon]
MPFDVHVVGGGPAGCFAGIAACQQGKNVLLSEEHMQIGKPEACSGLVSKSGLEAMAPYVSYKKVMLNSIDSAKIMFSSGEEFAIKPKKEPAILVSRCGLDMQAAEAFENEGGKIRLGEKVTRKFEAKMIIGADGPASSVADFFGFPKINSYVACMQGDFSYQCENPNQAEVHLSARDFPGFFGWAIPINEERAKIGLGVALPSHPLPYYRRFLKKLGVKGKPVEEFAAVIPTSVRRMTAKQSGSYSVLLAGDAAGQVKATTGGGIFFGSMCGFIAGKNVGSPENYVREWKKAYGLDLALHQAFRKLLNLGNGEPHPLLVLLAKRLFFEEWLSNEGRMDRWSRMLSLASLLSYAKLLGSKALVGK